MKAISLVPGTKNVHVIDREDPKIEKPTQAKVRVLQVGICGTDRDEVSGGRADAPKGEKELVIGHEMLGQIIETGKGVKTLKKGDLVVIMVRRPCNVCDPCKKGCPDMCASGLYTERGIRGRHGFDAEIVVDEEMYMIKVPPSLKSIAVLTEPTTVVEKAIDHACRLQVARLPLDNSDPKKWLSGKTALVAGLGPVGLLACMVLSLRGAKVFGMDIVDPSTPRPHILQGMGGKYMQGSLEELEKAGSKADLIVEAAGIAKLDFELLDALAINGVYVLTGVSEDNHPFQVKGGTLMRELVLKNQIIFGSVNAGKQHFQQAVADLEAAQKKWPIVEQLITSRIPYNQFDKVLTQHPKDEIKAVLEWSA